MLEVLSELLKKEPGLKRLQIAKKSGFNKKDVSRTLHAEKCVFEQSLTHRWYLKDHKQLEINFPSGCWLSSREFETALSLTGSPLSVNCSTIVFTFPKECKILLDAISRILSLCNQLAHENKKVILKFFDQVGCSFLDRVGFFEQLDDEVIVCPERPLDHKSQTFKGNNHATVEFGEINISSPDQSIPEQLVDSFIASAGKSHEVAALTVISESFLNVIKHSQTPISGFVALQAYKKSKKPHIQTVISDSGLGIIGTLKPGFKTNYEDLASYLDLEKVDDQIKLILKILNDGGISCEGVGAGAGLKSSGDLAAKYNAKISIRQETFELELEHIKGQYKISKNLRDMPLIRGTHICFDFFLKQTPT